MNDIIGMTDLSLESELNRSQRENWLLVRHLARSLLLIIDNLSDISKRKCHRKHFSTRLLTNFRSVETGRIVMERVSFSFRQTVFGILKTLVVRAAGNNVDLTYDVDPDIPDQLIGDFLRLQQVITNLVTNVIKFTSPCAGHVSLSCRRLAHDNSTVTLEVCVSDNGTGVAKDKLNLISGAFAQADCSMIRVRAASYICSSANKPVFSLKEYEGVGLGLSISKCLVSLMGRVSG
jgi:osomolarity two-component system sensor histidine kinase NIK1